MSDLREKFATADVDWTAVAAELDGVPVIDEPALVKQKSRDFFWYSPVLNKQLKRTYGDIVVRPRNEADVLKVAEVAVRRRLPVTVRGAGTGNYGQAVPLAGGIVLEMMGLNQIHEIRPGAVRLGPGVKLLDLDNALKPQGWEMRFYPSTRRTASIGGYVAGGSSGVGSITYGILRDRGNVLGARVVTLEETPRVLTLEGDAVQRVNHAYGTNGIITEVTVATAPAQTWVDSVVTFPDFMTACRFAQALGEAPGIVKKLITVIASPIGQDYFKGLNDVLPAGHAIVLTMVADHALGPFDALVADWGGTTCYRATAAEAEAAGAVPLYEYAWNHTTLQALKVDKSITYLQILFPPPDHLALVEHMHNHFGCEVPAHLEFVHFGGQVACFGLPIVRYTTDERLAEIIAYHEDHGAPIFNPHDYTLEGGGMKKVDEEQLAFKREADPFGLLNPGKMLAWDDPAYRPDDARVHLYGG